MRTIMPSIKPNVLATIILIVISATLASAQSEKILYSFTGQSDGGEPYPGLVADGKGNLYGTTVSGGTEFGGTVFELTPNSNGTWTENALYSFTGVSNPSDGAAPLGGLVLDGKGNLYGTTSVGGGVNFQGTVFELSSGPNGTWSEKVIHSFTGGSDGANPDFGLTLDAAGNLYGTTTNGGTLGFGSVFELVPGSNGTWNKRTLHSFTGGNDGSMPTSPLVLDGHGNLYGLTTDGGVHDYGVVFQLTPQSTGPWTEQVVHAFTGSAGGTGSLGAVALDQAGNVYAEAFFSVLEFSPATGGTWTSKTLHTFTGGTDGAQPEGGLSLDNAGNLYGMTYTGGLHRGTVFELSPSTNGTWTEKILHRFTSGADGAFPEFNYLNVDPKGNVYGTTFQGGSSNQGIVFEITP